MESVLCAELVGIYLMAGVSVTRQRLTLGLDGRYQLEDYRDLGGHWTLLNRGEYQANAETVSFEREFASKHRAEYATLAEPMHLRRTADQLLLVPQRWLDDFDGRQGLEGIEGMEAMPGMSPTYLGLGWYAFLKQALPRVRVCRQARSYCHALTPGKRYLAQEETATAVRIVADHGRLRWFPQDCFEALATIDLSVPEIKTDKIKP